jgi:outer membrane immunogenic protein
MNKKNLALIASLMLLAATAQAQSKFDGLYGQVGVGYENITPTFNSSGLNVVGTGNIPISTNVSSQGSVMGVATIGYNAAYQQRFSFGRWR